MMKDNKTQGIIFIIIAGFFFSLMTLFVRLAGNVPTLQKAFFRNAVALIFITVVLARSAEGFRIKKGSLPMLFLRAICGTIGIICNFYAVDKLNIADANILNKLSPFFAIIFSYFILKEKASFLEWMCVVFAFIGAVFVVKPSMNMSFAYAMIGVCGGLGAGIAYAFVRKLGKHGERGPVIIFFFSAFSCLVMVPNIILNFVPMKPLQWIFLVGAGLSATGGQVFITKAYTKAAARDISVFDYTQVIFAAILGYIVLGQVPDWMSFAGYAIIIGSAIFKWAIRNKDT